MGGASVRRMSGGHFSEQTDCAAGARSMGHGAWGMEHGAWSMAHGTCEQADRLSAWSMYHWTMSILVRLLNVRMIFLDRRTARPQDRTTLDLQTIKMSPLRGSFVFVP